MHNANINYTATQTLACLCKQVLLVVQKTSFSLNDFFFSVEPVNFRLCKGLSETTQKERNCRKLLYQTVNLLNFLHSRNSRAGGSPGISKLIINPKKLYISFTAIF
jgi:hypothetical protein